MKIHDHLRKSVKTEQILAATSEEFKEINNFDDLELTEEELSDSEKNTIQFARNHKDLRFSDMNDIMVNASEERSIEPIHHSQASIRPNNIRSALSGVNDKGSDLLDETDYQCLASLAMAFVGAAFSTAVTIVRAAGV